MDHVQLSSSCFEDRRLLGAKWQALWLNMTTEVICVHDSINYSLRNVGKGPGKKPKVGLFSHRRKATSASIQLGTTVPTATVLKTHISIGSIFSSLSISGDVVWASLVRKIVPQQCKGAWHAKPFWWDLWMLTKVGPWIMELTVEYVLSVQLPAVITRSTISPLLIHFCAFYLNPPLQGMAFTVFTNV